MLQWSSWFFVYHGGFWLFSFSYSVQFLTYSFSTVHILTCWIFLKTKIHNTHIIIPAYTESVYVYRPSDRSERKRKNRKTKNEKKNDCNLVVYDDTICGEQIEWWFVIRFFFFFFILFRFICLICWMRRFPCFPLVNLWCYFFAFSFSFIWLFDYFIIIIFYKNTKLIVSSGSIDT